MLVKSSWFVSFHKLCFLTIGYYAKVQRNICIFISLKQTQLINDSSTTEDIRREERHPNRGEKHDPRMFDLRGSRTRDDLQKGWPQ